MCLQRAADQHVVAVSALLDADVGRNAVVVVVAVARVRRSSPGKLRSSNPVQLCLCSYAGLQNCFMWHFFLCETWQHERKCWLLCLHQAALKGNFDSISFWRGSIWAVKQLAGRDHLWIGLWKFSLKEPPSAMFKMPSIDLSLVFCTEKTVCVFSL